MDFLAAAPRPGGFQRVTLSAGSSSIATLTMTGITMAASHGGDDLIAAICDSIIDLSMEPTS
jgi:hypothetical protein